MTIPSSRKHPPRAYCVLQIFDRNATRVFFNRGNIQAVLLQDNDCGTIGRDVLVSSCRGICIGEFHCAKVAEGHVYIILRVIFDDPLGILLTKCGALGLEDVFCHLPCGQVLDLGCTTIGRSCGDCEPDLVTRIYGKAVEECRIRWIPLIPS